MKRSLLIEKLKKYNPTNEEFGFKKDIISFVNSYENCFDRSLAIGHVTASCWLLNKDHSQALLMHHAKLNQWYQLGGHCDGDGDVLKVAIKEAQEESGIMGIIPVDENIFDIDVHLIPENSREKAHYHYDIRFLLSVMSDEQSIKNNESKELLWITKDATTLPTCNNAVVRLFNKWIMREL